MQRRINKETSERLAQENGLKAPFALIKERDRSTPFSSVSEIRTFIANVAAPELTKIVALFGCQAKTTYIKYACQFFEKLFLLANGDTEQFLEWIHDPKKIPAGVNKEHLLWRDQEWRRSIGVRECHVTQSHYVCYCDELTYPKTAPKDR